MFATRDSRFRYSNTCTVIISLAKHHTICEVLITMIWKLFDKLNLNQSSSLISQSIPGWLVGWHLGGHMSALYRMHEKVQLVGHGSVLGYGSTLRCTRESALGWSWECTGMDESNSL